MALCRYWFVKEDKREHDRTGNNDAAHVQALPVHGRGRSVYRGM